MRDVQFAKNVWKKLEPIIPTIKRLLAYSLAETLKFFNLIGNLLVVPLKAIGKIATEVADLVIVKIKIKLREFAEDLQREWPKVFKFFDYLFKGALTN